MVMSKERLEDTIFWPKSKIGLTPSCLEWKMVTISSLYE